MPPRRKSAKKSPTPSEAPEGITITELPLQHPDRDQKPLPGGAKTLYEIIAERQGELGLNLDPSSSTPPKPTKSTASASGSSKKAPIKGAKRIIPDPNARIVELDSDEEIDEGIVGGEKEMPEVKVVKVNKYGEMEDEGEGEIEVVGRAMQTFFFAVPLGLALLFLEVLVRKQYGMDDWEWPELAAKSAKGFCVMYILHYLIHPYRSWKITQAVALVLGATCGCYIVWAVNEKGYYAVTRKVPPIGTLWVWSVIVMNEWLGLVNCVVVGAFVKWGGYQFSV